MLEALTAEALRPVTDPADLPFATTAELETLHDGIGQERASRALRFGMDMRAPGYNVFVLGDAATDRAHLAQLLLEQQAADRPVAEDLCYVHNFARPDAPLALRLVAGQGRRLRDGAEQLVEDIRSVIPSIFSEDEFRSRINEITGEFQQQQQADLEALGEQAAEQGLRLLQTPQGFAFAPVREDKVLDNEAFQQLPEDERKAITEAIEAMTAALMERMQQMPGRQQAMVRAQKAVAREFTEAAVAHMVSGLRQRFQTYPAVAAWISAVEQDVVEHAQVILGLSNDDTSSHPLGARPEQTFFNRYRVNLLVDHAGAQGAPVEFASNPTLEHLLGSLEHRVEMGNLVTDITLIKAGALHRANGGFLVIEAERLLTKPFAWDALKRALYDAEIRIENAGDYLGLGRTASLDPEPIALDVKVVLIGSRLLYYLLSEYDTDIAQLFKVPADLADRIDRSTDNIILYARMLGSIASREQLRPLGADAVARIIDHSARLVGDSTRLSAHTQRLADLVREADHAAGRDGAEQIDADHVRRAIADHIERQDRIREDVHDRITDGTVHIDLEGARSGQVNGLSVLQVGGFAFGQPSRISATARLGRGEVVDIEREAKLGGNIHSKAVMIVTAFIGQRYAAERPLSLGATLVFEQSYGGIEGDSASVAEVCALLSAVADLPLRQDIAMTGSMDQYGAVQAIGGVNEKIEGFFDVCSARGLSGTQGVLIPASNRRHLMLREDVVEACAGGRFSVHTMDSVDDALALLSGMPVADVDAAVRARLDALTERAMEQARRARGGDEVEAGPT